MWTWVVKITGIGHPVSEYTIMVLTSHRFLPPDACGLILLFISWVSVDVAVFKSDHQL
jgi:hypothetical protein